MLKVLSSVFLFTVAFSGYANDSHPALKTCFKSAKSFYNKNGPSTDVARGFGKLTVLSANTSYQLQNKVNIEYPVDTVLYQGTGSYHSGYFIDVIIVDAKTCHGLDIINVYGE